MLRKLLILALMVSILGLALPAFAVTEPTGNKGNLSAQESGDAIYRTGAYGYSHAGLYYKLYDSTHMVIHVVGDILDVIFLIDIVHIRPLEYHSSIPDYFKKSGATYLGAYTNLGYVKGDSDKREDIIGTALAAEARTDLYYTFMDMISWDGWSWNGTIADLREIRCDGLVEVCYELNSVKVWGKNQQESHYLIDDYPSEHNNEPNYWYKGTPDPDTEVCPSVQRGGYGLTYTKLRPSEIVRPSNPTSCTETHGVTSGSWQGSTSNPNFTWSGASDDSGVHGYYYYWGTSSSGTSSNYTTLSGYDPSSVGDGTYYLRVRAKDKAGNEASSWTTLFVFKYDGTDPSTPSISSAVSHDWQTNNDPSFSWSSSDSGSGIDGYYYEIDDSTPNDWTTGTSKQYYNISDGSHTFYAKAKDNAGNESNTGSYGFKIDTTNPSNPTSCTDSHSVQSNIWQNDDGDPNFTWSGASDAASGVNGYYYYWGTSSSGTSSSYTTSSDYNPYSMSSGTHYLRVRTKDNVGHAASWKTMFIYRYDSISPSNPIAVSSSSHTTSSWSNDNTVAVSWSGASDSHSGIAGYSYEWSQSSTTTPNTTVDTTGTSALSLSLFDADNWYFHVRSKDAAGNWASEAKHYGPFYIDATVPSAPTVSSSTHPSQSTPYASDDPSFSWTAPSDTSGIAGYSYTLDQNASTTPDTTIDTTGTSKSYSNKAVGTWYFHVRAKDNAGNWGSTQHYTVIIGAKDILSNTNAVTIAEGGTAIFRVKLNAKPSSNVVVSVARVSGDTDISVSSGSSLTFTTSNWNTYKTVTLAAATDADAVNSTATIRCSATGWTSKDVTATEDDAQGSLPITSPNGGETWEQGTSHNIIWTSSGNPGDNVKLEYSTNNGTNWTQITASTANDGTHPWTVPDAASTQCIVRITSTTKLDITDTSNATFTIIGSAQHLAFSVQPTDTVATEGTTPAISPSPAVKICDSAGSMVTSSSASVTVSLTGGGGSSATLLGTKTKSASSGVATFNDLRVTRAGTDFQLHATSSGLIAADSSNIEVVDRIVINQSATRAFESADPSYTYTATGGSNQPTYVWTSSNDDAGVIDRSTGVFTPATVKSGSQDTTIRAADPNYPNIYDELPVTVYASVIIPSKPIEPPIVYAGKTSDIFTVTGGGESYTWTVKGRVAVEGDTGSSFAFTAPSDGAFAGVYTITVTDVNGFYDSFDVYVPLEFTPLSKNINGGEEFELVLAGAGPGAQVSAREMLDENLNVVPEDQTDEYASVTPDLSIYFVDNEACATVTGADVTDLKMFRFRVTVAGDDDHLNEENGLNVAISGWIRVLPAVTYSGVVQDHDGTPVANAAIMFKRAGLIQGKTTSADDGQFSVDLLSPEVTFADYDVVVTAEGYLARSDITTEGWVDDRTIQLIPESSNIPGQVMENDGVTPIEGAKVECTVDDETYVAYSATDGSYALCLPVTLPGTLEARASAVGYVAVIQDIVANSNFTLAPLASGDQVGPAGGTFIGGSAESPCIVDIPADALDGTGTLEIDPNIEVGEESPYTKDSVVLLEISITGADINPDNPIQVTMPFDTANVNSGDFVRGNKLIYYSDNADNLRDGIDVVAVAVDDIICEDHSKGLVSFLVRHLSVFGAGTSNQPPTASFTVDPTSGESPLTVTFNATASSDPDGTIESYVWDFGDGSTGSGQTTSHEYTSESTYTVTLTVTDDDSLTDTATATITATDDCFIATAAYGSGMADHVVALKEFRDNILLKNSVGRSFMRFYYKISPPLADYIKDHESLKTAVRIGLMPFVAISYSALHFGPIITLTGLVVLFAIPLLLVSFYRRKARG